MNILSSLKTLIVKGMIMAANSWFFYQQKIDSTGTPHSVTLHYEVHPKGVLRVTNRSDRSNISYEFISGQELDNFMIATRIYHDRVMRQVYGRNISLDKKTA